MDELFIILLVQCINVLNNVLNRFLSSIYYRVVFEWSTLLGRVVDFLWSTVTHFIYFYILYTSIFIRNKIQYKKNNDF